MNEKVLAEKIDTLLTDNDLLRKHLVKVSFAAVGINAKLDNELHTLRNLVRSDAVIEKINQQVESIARLLMTIDDELEQNTASLSQQQILQGLLEQLSKEFPDLKQKIERIITSGVNHPLFKTLDKLVKILPQKKQTNSFFSRLFNLKSASTTENTFYAESIQQIQRTIFQFLDQLNVPEKFKPQISHVREFLAELDSIDRVPDVMSSISALVLDINSEDKSRFEHFLNQLNQRLDIVQDLLNTHAEAQLKDEQASKIMDTKVRAQVHSMQENVVAAKDLNELQHNVENRLEQVISNLDVFQEVHETFVKKNQEKMGLLNNQLNESRSDINELQHKLQKQQHLAETDPLTSLPNRYAFQRKINEEYMRWRRYRHPLTLAIADVDHFKKINDEFGHTNGDKVLAGLARGLLAASRETDFIARYGGEEFIMILPETHLNQATKAVNKIRQNIASNPFQLDQSSQNITLSIGVAEFEDNDTIEDVINRADVALYRAKDKGRNTVCCELKNPSA